MALWNNDTEIQFFTEALKNFASPEQIFYNLEGGYYAYVPKEQKQKDRHYKAEIHLSVNLQKSGVKHFLNP